MPNKQPRNEIKIYWIQLNFNTQTRDLKYNWKINKKKKRFYKSSQAYQATCKGVNQGMT